MGVGGVAGGAGTGAGAAAAGWLEVGDAGEPPPHADTIPATPSESHHRAMRAHGINAGSTGATSRRVIGEEAPLLAHAVALVSARWLIASALTLHDAWVSAELRY